MARIARVALIVSVLIGSGFAFSPSALAHGSCSLTGGLLWSVPYPGAVTVQGWGQRSCTYSHYSSSGDIELDIYRSGSWHTVADSNYVTECCNKKTVTIWTHPGKCFPRTGTYTWRLLVGY